MAGILIPRSIGLQKLMLTHRNKILLNVFCRGITCKASKYNQKFVQPSSFRPGETFEERNARLKRPLSPHATIHKNTIQMITSISHRITGTFNAMYLYTFAGIALLLPFDFNHLIEMIEGLELSNMILIPCRFCFAFPFVYHAMSGARFVFFVTGIGLNNSFVKATGIALLVASVIATGLIAVFV